MTSHLNCLTLKGIESRATLFRVSQNEFSWAQLRVTRNITVPASFA